MTQVALVLFFITLAGEVFVDLIPAISSFFSSFNATFADIMQYVSVFPTLYNQLPSAVKYACFMLFVAPVLYYLIRKAFSVSL